MCICVCVYDNERFPGMMEDEKLLLCDQVKKSQDKNRYYSYKGNN